MEVLWMGLSIFAVICTSFLLTMGLIKGMLIVTRGSSRVSRRNDWMPLQIFSGDDALDHPDLKNLAEVCNHRNN